MIREACVEGFNQALRAQESGAERIELCADLKVGGITPSIGTIITCKKYLHIPVVVMIRPRGGNFVYNTQEIGIMAEDIRACVQAGADGIAIGLLRKDATIDMHNLQKLSTLAGTMPITFHKAIDATQHIEDEFCRLLHSGLIHRVLTSGGALTALEGAGIINKLITLSAGRISIIAAGKVDAGNVDRCSQLIKAEEFHGKRIVGDLNE